MPARATCRRRVSRTKGSPANNQLYGTDSGPSSIGQAARCQSFVKDFAYTLGWEQTQGWSILPGTTASDIMGCFTPQALPVLSALARGYAVCDHWFASVPTETLANRAFTCAGTSQGHMGDQTKTFTCPTIFASLDAKGIGWAVYGYNEPPLTKSTFTDIAQADATHFGLFTDFQGAAAAGALPAFTFWSRAGPRRATASTPTTTWRSASSSSTTCTRRCAPAPAGPRRCS